MGIDKIRECSTHCSTSNADKHVSTSASNLFESQAKPGGGLLVSKGGFEPAEVASKKCSVFVSLPGGCCDC